MQRQKTIGSDVSFSGVGLFTGEKSRITLRPAPAGTGIIFRRMDLAGTPTIPARLEFVSETVRCTKLRKDNVTLTMVEHLLSALRGLDVDNVMVEIHGPEVPCDDGSARLFCQKIDSVGIVELGEERSVVALSRPVYFSQGETHIVALPSPELKISYILHHPGSPLLYSQYKTLTVCPDSYRREISSSRTFTLYEEIAPFLEKGLIRGGGLENGVVIRGDLVMNPEGLRMPDEPVRHKILDLIGDLSLLGTHVLAHIVAIRSGHTSHVAFAKLLEAFVQPEVQCESISVGGTR